MHDMARKKTLAKENPVQVDTRSWVKPQHRKRNTPKAKARHYAKQKERRRRKGEEWLAKKRAKDAARLERRTRGEPRQPPPLSLQPNPDRPAKVGGAISARLQSKPKIKPKPKSETTSQHPAPSAAETESVPAAPTPLIVTPFRDESLPPFERKP